MSRDEIARYLGLVLETVSRGFSRLHEDGVIEVRGRRVRILDNLSRPGVEQNLQWLRSRSTGGAATSGGGAASPSPATDTARTWNSLQGG